MSAGSRTGWYWSDWLGDQAVRRLTPAERGVWIDLLALMAAAAPAGYLCDDRGRPLTHEEIARVTNAGSPVEVAELIAGILDKGVASRDRTGRLFNRRMVRDVAMAAKKQRNGRLGGEATRLKWQSFQAQLEQNAQQVPRHKNGPPIPLSKKITSSFLDAAKEENGSAIDLASALPSGALARSPLAEQGEAKKLSDVVPVAVSRAMLDAIYEARRRQIEAGSVDEKKK